MKKNNKHIKSTVCALSLVALTLGSAVSLACTRLVYKDINNPDYPITARSMDWAEDTETNLWIFPRELKRSGAAGPHSLEWTSKYGSVIASAFDSNPNMASTTDGVNEKGLAANVLWLAESEYPKAAPTAKKPGLSIAAWAQYVLDNFATVDEAVKALQEEKFTLVTKDLPHQDRKATLHLSLSDSSGDSAIIEYIDGKQVIHHNKDYQVMTNSPTFDQQLTLNAYWDQIGGNVMLPGTNRAADRFVRASFYVKHVAPNKLIPGVAEKSKIEKDKADLATAFSIIRNASVPYGYSLPDMPNISSTRWRTVIDHKSLQYFFESAVSPNIFWVDLKKIDFAPRGDNASKLDLGPNQSTIYSGQASAHFKPATPFKFAGL
ncbi:MULTISPECIES: linear amide C-N hydrolase [Pectobacterium]|uniref:Choloylglycine hydrolase n=1 Tax=Pectobacterium carotovorum subsp. carotovorum (strain PC1) TaxID=561230 RepID=C6DBF1_PECCP|nr:MULTISPECIES: linear amide C-N hydrolase [Pectobacterium]ACT14014.1 Choloylglycine hydrolase [Pectobacterium carotovorum subsp. carotovorum PC1]MBA5600662.1 linear amide C-N hydrolase [Pectobacterium aroidearum]QPI44258.1 linear amide C-N hydrolase [Pectobacterium aroidearum]UUE37559.1 linear amide C-N hydrolase [Pectobacterium aroidearum]UUE41936.1 linear amide C-N hydrolase [Pectobacterium aroidearum]